MTSCLATIIFVPRERFNMTAKSLESIIANTNGPYEFICVDGNAPDAVRDYLQEKCQDHGFTLLRSNEYLTPTEARNAALKYVATPYAVFIDNDVLVEDGWLEVLIRCAEETDAWLVGPLYLEERSGTKRVHMFGGEVSLINKPAGLDFQERHHLQHKKIEDAATDQLVRKTTGLLEFHTLLARMEVFDKLGPLDTGLMNGREHADLSYAVGAAGGKMYVEPTAVITYIIPEPNELDGDDLKYFRLRWCDAWSRETIRHFCEKYGLRPSSRGIIIRKHWGNNHRRLITAAFPKTRRILGSHLFKLLEKFLIAPLELLRSKLDFSHEECVLKRKPNIVRVETDSPLPPSIGSIQG